jgi:hypothetical protein
MSDRAAFDAVADARATIFAGGVALVAGVAHHREPQAGGTDICLSFILRRGVSTP